MFEIFLDLLAVESSYKIYTEAIHSNDWMMIPFFGLAASIVIPSMMSMANKISDQRARRISLYIAVGFFTWAGIMIITLIDNEKYNEIVAKNLNEYVDSLNCDQLLDFISYYRTENPRYIYDYRQAEIEEKYFKTCGIMK